MSLISVMPNADEGDNKPMIIGGQTRTNSLVYRGLFKKKPQSPRQNSNIGVGSRSYTDEEHTTPSNSASAASSTHDTMQAAPRAPRSKTKKKTSDKTIFSKLGKMFKSKHNIGDDFSDANQSIDDKLRQEQEDKERSFNMLLLGAGGSGKTTVLKQMDKLYNGDIDEKELAAAERNIHRNILQDVFDLCKYNIKLNSDAANDVYKLTSPGLIDSCHRISTWVSSFIMQDSSTFLNRKLAVEIDALWRDPAMKRTWEKRRNSHIMDNTPYFLDKILEIISEPSPQQAHKKYRVTFDDFVRVRDQTTGIMVKQFSSQTQFGKYNFSVTDVGGQRAERRKWMRCFDNIQVVVYIMSLAAYDQHLYEENTRNCWDETLELFSKTSKEPAFSETDWVVFFNKVDIFEIKIAKVPFTVYQPNFNELHAHNSQMVKEFICDAFTHRFYDGMAPQRKKKRGNLYFHVTCATKQESVGEIIKKVQLDLIKSQMKKMGYLL